MWYIISSAPMLSAFRCLLPFKVFGNLSVFVVVQNRRQYFMPDSASRYLRWGTGRGQYRIHDTLVCPLVDQRQSHVCRSPSDIMTACERASVYLYPKPTENQPTTHRGSSRLLLKSPQSSTVGQSLRVKTQRQSGELLRSRLQTC